MWCYLVIVSRVMCNLHMAWDMPHGRLNSFHINIFFIANDNMHDESINKKPLPHNKLIKKINKYLISK